MNDVQVASTASAGFLDPGYAGATPTVPSGPTSLLPQPQPLSDEDAMAGLLALESRSRSVSLARTISNINSLRKEQRVEWEKQKAALFEAAKAQEDSGFWGSVGKICGAIGKVAAVVTSVAVAVGTGGAGLPLTLAVAGACLSTAALVESEFDVLQKLGVDAQTSDWIEFGLAIAAVGCTVGAAWTGGANSATQLEKAADTAEKVSSAAAGGATITSGIATRKKYAADADAEDRFADATSARLNEARYNRMLLQILDDLEESERSYRHTVGAAKGAAQIEDNTLLISIGRN
jgi:hypothetical protein